MLLVVSISVFFHVLVMMVMLLVHGDIFSFGSIVVCDVFTCILICHLFWGMEALRVFPGGDQVDGLPPAPSTGAVVIGRPVTLISRSDS